MPDNEIDKAKKKALEALKSRIDEMGTAANAIWIKSIEEIFDFKAGKILIEKDFVKQLNKLTVDVLDLIQKEPKFTGPVSKFVKRLNPISEAITDFQKETNNIKVPEYEIQKKIVVDEIIDQMLDNGLNQGFVQPVRDILYQNASPGGLSLTGAKELIKDYISGGKDETGKLGKYVENTAQQAVDGYSGIINKKLLEEFPYDGLLITGSLIDNSSPQCRYAIEELGGKITKENWPKLKEIAEKHGLREGTTFENLPVRLLHHGCRHGFYPFMTKKQEAA